MHKSFIAAVATWTWLSMATAWGSEGTAAVPAEANALQAFVDLVADDNATLLRGIASAAREGEPFFEPALWGVFENHPGSPLRQRVVAAVAGLAWPADEQALNRRIANLTAVLNDDNDPANVDAATGLGLYASPMAQRALAARVNTTQGPLHKAVLAALDMVHSPDSLNRMGAWLSNTGQGLTVPPSEWHLTAAAYDLLQNQNVQAVAILASADDAQRVRPLVWWAAEQDEEPVQFAAMQALHNRPLASDTNICLDLALNSKSANVRTWGAGALGTIHSADIADIAVKQLSVEHDARVLAVWSQIIAAQPAPWMAERINAEQDSTVRIALLNAVAGRTDAPLLAAIRTAARSPDARVADAAVRALTPTDEDAQLLTTVVETYPTSTIAYDKLFTLQPPATIAGLRTLARTNNLPTSLQLRVIKDLGERGDKEDIPRLKLLAAGPPNADTTHAAHEALHKLDPAHYAAWDNYGRVPLVLASTGFGATMMSIATDLANASSTDTLLLGIGGGILGLSTSALLTMNHSVSVGEAGYFSTLGFWGTLGGYGLAQLMVTQDNTTAGTWGALVGESVSVALGGLTLRAAAWSPADSLLTNMLAVSTGLAAISWQSLAGVAPNSAAGAGDAFAVGALATTLPMTFLSPHLRVQDTGGTIPASMLGAMWLGVLGPVIFSSDGWNGLDMLQGAGIGQSAGLLTGLLLAQRFQLPSLTALAFTGDIVLGALDGGGLQLMASSWSNSTTALAMATSTVVEGAVLGTVATLLPDDGHGTSGGLSLHLFDGVVAGGYFGAWLPGLWEPVGTVNINQQVGGTLVGLNGGLLLAALADLAHRADGGDAGEMAMWLTLGALAGTGLGGVVDPAFGPTGSGLLLGTGALTWLAGEAAWPHTDYAGADAGLITLLTAEGGLAFAGLPNMLTNPNVTVLSSVVMGMGFGGLLGMGLSQALHLDGADLGETAVTTVGGGVFGLGLLCLSPNQQAQLAPTVAMGVSTALALGIAPYTSYEAGDAATLTASTLSGVWYGTWLGTLSGSSGYKPAGGALLGASLGLGVSAAVAQFTTPPPAADIGEAMLAQGAGSLMGYGLGTVANARTSISTSLMLGGGLLGAVGGYLWAPYTEYTGVDAGITVLTTAVFSGYGALLPSALSSQPSSDATLGGALLGAGVGLGGGMVLAAHTEVDASDVGLVLLSSLAGDGIGWGLAGVLNTRSTTQAALVEVGGVGGGILAVALAPHVSHDRPDAPFILVGSTLLAFQGIFLPGLTNTLTGNSALEGATLGASIGIAAGLGVSPILKLDGGELGEMVLSALAGDAMGVGLGLWLNRGTPLLTGLFEVGGLSGAVLGAWASQHHLFSHDDVGLVAYGALMGTWLGAWTPELWNGETGSNAGAGMLLGMGAGGVATAWLSQAMHYNTRQVGEVLIGGTSGAALGAGLGLLTSGNDAVWAGMMDGAAILGTGIAAAVAPQERANPHSGGVGTLAGLYGLYQGAGISGLLSANNRQLGGAMLFSAAAGTLLGTYLGDRLHLETSDILVLLGGSAWGVWVGAWTAAVIANDFGKTPAGGGFVLGVGTSAVATDVALALTAYGVSRLGHLPPLRFAWISIAGGVGLLGGLSASALSAGSLDSESGVLFGSAGGLLLGSFITAFVDFGSMAAPQHAAHDDDGTESAPWLPRVKQWMPNVQMMADESWRQSHPDAMPPVMLTVSGQLI